MARFGYFKYFNSRPHGGRRFALHFSSSTVSFQLTPSRRATNAPITINHPILFQLTPSRRATPPPLPFQRAIGHFNSRPHGGRRCPRTVQVGRFKFQLTPSRRATTRTILPATPRLHFNSRPHGGRPLLTIVFVCSGISTHALTEGDFILKYQDNIRFLFQLTPSRRATERTLTYYGKELFQLTPSRRATAWDKGGVYVETLFQLTPSRRATTVYHHRNQPGAFQLTPSRRATNPDNVVDGHLDISTHALTEGDGKFRQIFLLNRGYAYSISLYFLPHFISLLPQILSFQQKSFKFQVRIFLLFSVHLAFALQNQCVHHVKYRFCTNMFYFVFVLFTQIVKPQTIGLFIYDFF